MIHIECLNNLKEIEQLELEFKISDYQTSALKTGKIIIS